MKHLRALISRHYLQKVHVLHTLILPKRLTWAFHHLSCVGKQIIIISDGKYFFSLGLNNQWYYYYKRIFHEVKNLDSKTFLILKLRTGLIIFR